MKKNSRFKRPAGIVAARVAVGTNPPMLSSGGQVHLFVKGSQPTKYAKVAAPKKSSSGGSSSSESSTTTTTTETTTSE